MAPEIESTVTRSSTDDSLKRSEQFYDDDGDFTLISADGVAFRLKRFHLQAASDTIEVGSGETTIHLSDERLETSKVITEVLEVLLEGKSCIDIKISTFAAFMDFLKKYEMNSVIALVKLQIESAMSRKVSGWAVFQRAILVNDAALVARSITYFGTEYAWVHTETGGWNGGESGVAALDIRAMPYSMMMLESPATAWALLRASLVATKNGKIDAAAISEEYLRLMRHSGGDAVTA